MHKRGTVTLAVTPRPSWRGLGGSVDGRLDSDAPRGADSPLTRGSPADGQEPRGGE